MARDRDRERDRGVGGVKEREHAVQGSLVIVKELHLSIYLSIKEKTQVRLSRSSQSSGGDRDV